MNAIKLPFKEKSTKPNANRSNRQLNKTEKNTVSLKRSMVKMMNSMVKNLNPLHQLKLKSQQ
jgi:predicted secreted protein